MGLAGLVESAPVTAAETQVGGVRDEADPRIRGLHSSCDHAGRVSAPVVHDQDLDILDRGPHGLANRVDRLLEVLLLVQRRYQNRQGDVSVHQYGPLNAASSAGSSSRNS